MNTKVLDGPAGVKSKKTRVVRDPRTKAQGQSSLQTERFSLKGTSSRTNAIEKVMSATSKGAQAFLAAPKMRLSYLGMFGMPLVEIVPLIRDGLPATVVPQTARDMGVAIDTLYAWLKFPRSTINRKVSERSVLSPDVTEKLIGLQRLIGLVENIMAESGSETDFNAAHWVAGWLEQPLPAFGNKKPADYMDTVTGQDMVARALARMQSGAYA